LICSVKGAGVTFLGHSRLKFYSGPNFSSLARDEFNISGLRRKHLRAHLPDLSDSQLSRLLKSLRVHGLIKRAGHSCKHYLTAFGRRVVTTGLKLKQLIIIPCLAQSTHA
jgi:hypothetical protein